MNKDFKVRAVFSDVDGTLLNSYHRVTPVTREWIQTELLETLDMPPVSDYDDITLKENEHIRMIGVIVRLYEGWDE